MCFFLFLREREGLFNGQMGIGMYNWYMLRRYASFFPFVDLLRDGLRDAREKQQKKWAGGGTDFYGEEKLGGWDFVGPGTSHFLLGTRYVR